MHVYNAIAMGVKAASTHNTDSSFISQQTNLQIPRYGFLVFLFLYNILEKVFCIKKFQGTSC